MATSRWERLAAAEARQVERVTNERYQLTGQDLEDLVLIASDGMTAQLAGWVDRRTIAELARRALHAYEAA